MASTTLDPQIDLKLVRELADILKDAELSEIEVEKGELRVRVARKLNAVPGESEAALVATATAPVHVPASAPQALAPGESINPESHPGAVTSPLVGTAYLRPSPDADPFKMVGDTVKEGETVLLVEAMKTFNPITAPRAGKITQLLVEDAQPVEYGEALFIIG